MTQEYLQRHFEQIIGHESEIESRLVDADCTIADLTADNKSFIDGFRNAGEQIVLINDDYGKMIEAILRDEIP